MEVEKYPNRGGGKRSQSQRWKKITIMEVEKDHNRGGGKRSFMNSAQNTLRFRQDLGHGKNTETNEQIWLWEIHRK